MPSIEEYLQQIFSDERWTNPGMRPLCPEDLLDEAFDQSKDRAVDAAAFTAEEKRQLNYQLNHLRQNCISFLPIRSDEKVLEIGSDCGTLTTYLAAHAAHVTCIETSEEKNQVNRLRNQEKQNISYFTGNFIQWENQNSVKKKERITEETEKFDRIYMIGSFPFAAEYMTGDHPYEELLRKLKTHLTTQGQLMIATPNALGLKYFAGSREDYTRGYFIGMEGFKDYRIKTFTRKELLQLGETAGFAAAKMYYPFPDYIFPTAIYTDERQPGQGELANHFEGVAMEHMTMFDETLAFDQILEEGLFPELCNSFLVVYENSEKNNTEKYCMETELDSKMETSVQNKEHMVYTKYSNDRAPELNIRTIMTCEDMVESVPETDAAELSGKKEHHYHLYKTPDTTAATGQILRMQDACTALRSIYENTGMEPNRYQRRGDSIEFEFIKGTSIEEILDGYIDCGAYQQARATFLELAQKIRSGAQKAPFQMTEEFASIFQNACKYAKVRQLQKILEKKESFPVSDLDMIPANIFINSQNWTIIDYEWTFFFPIPIDFILYRGIHYYADTNEDRSRIDAAELYRLCGIAEEEIELYRIMEQDFQDYVVGNHTPLSIRSKQMIDMPTHHISHMVRHIENHVQRQQAELYYDRGEGFTSQDKTRLQNQDIEEDLRVTFDIPSDAKALRLNIWNYDSCLVEIREFQFGFIQKNRSQNEPGQQFQETDPLVKVDKSCKIEYLTSAYKVSENVVYFDHGSPAFYIQKIPEGCTQLSIDFHIIETDECVKQALVPKILWKRGLKKTLTGVLHRNHHK